jgi:hypothetical protein
MKLEELKTDAEQAQKNAEEHLRLHFQWLGVAQYLAQKIAAAEAAAQKSPAG